MQNKEQTVVVQQIEETKAAFEKVRKEIQKVIVGQNELVEALLVGLLADGHLLIEGMPGLAKTLAANTLAKVIQADFKRVQFTPDLLPADLIGTPIYHPKEGTFSVKKGPIFTHILLADEINRAPSKVQSALLEVMQEKQVTIGGETFQAPSPFLVLATQNPIEQEGTYPLAEAQTDRFMMKVTVSYPTRAEEKEILDKMGRLTPPSSVDAVVSLQELEQWRKLTDIVYLDDRVVDYILDIIQATRQPSPFLEYGASPRATIALKKAAKARALLAGRYFVIPEDIKEFVPLVLRHRLKLSYEAEAENLSADTILSQILAKIPLP